MPQKAAPQLVHLDIILSASFYNPIPDHTKIGFPLFDF
jgi:hypothetical protein